MTCKIAISGGGVAGLSAAWWLSRAGAEVTVLERAHDYAPLGHYISLKAHGVALISQMGLLEQCRSREVRTRTLRMYSQTGRLLREMPSEAVSAAIDGYLLFRRADLHASLYEAVKGCCDLRFGTQLRAIRQTPANVEVDLASGTERFDLLLGTDGIHSVTRRLVFGEQFLRPLGGRYVALTVDCRHGQSLDAVQMWWGRGQTVTLIPNSLDRISAIVYHGDGGIEPRGTTNADYRAFFDEGYAQFPGPVRRVLSALDEHGYVFADTIAMVDMPTIVKGRVALIGDAAHCPTFMSGMGSSLALEGARELARAIEAESDVPSALLRYEQSITPIANAYKASANKMKRLILSRNRVLEAARNAATTAIPNWALERQAKAFLHLKKA